LPINTSLRLVPLRVLLTVLAPLIALGVTMPVEEILNKLNHIFSLVPMPIC